MVGCFHRNAWWLFLFVLVWVQHTLNLSMWLQSGQKSWMDQGNSQSQGGIIKHSDSKLYSGVELRPWTFLWDLTLYLLIWTVSHINRSVHHWACKARKVHLMHWKIEMQSEMQIRRCHFYSPRPFWIWTACSGVFLQSFQDFVRV